MSSSIDGLSHDQKHSMPAVAVTIEVITTVLLWIRIGNRFASHTRLGLDDVLIIVAWLLGIGLTVTVLLGTEKYEMNRHLWDVTPKYFVIEGIIGFVVEVLFFWSTCFTKISVLLFYRRLVQGTLSRNFKLAIWAAMAFVVAYTITFFVIIVVACDPVKAIWLQYDLVWAPTHKFNCKSREVQTNVSRIIGSLSVLTDFYSVMLPAALVAQITVHRTQRIGLFFIFGVGFLVVGAGMARTYYLARIFSEAVDKTWWSWNVFLASIIECNVAIICACAPSVKALFGRYFNDVSERYSRSGRNNYWKNSGSSSAGDSKLNSQMSRDALGTELKTSINRSTTPSNSNPTFRKEQEDATTEERDEYPKFYLNDSSIEDTKPPTLPKFHRISPLQPSNLFGTTKTAPAAHGDLGVRPKSFLISPSFSDPSDDEISLVDKALYHNERPSHKVSELLQLYPYSEPRMPPSATSGSTRTLTESATRLSPTAFEEPQYPDSQIPFSDTRPRIRRDFNRERLERTRLPAI